MSTFNFLKRFFSLLLVGVLILPMASCGGDDEFDGLTADIVDSGKYGKFEKLTINEIPVYNCIEAIVGFFSLYEFEPDYLTWRNNTYVNEPAVRIDLLMYDDPTVEAKGGAEITLRLKESAFDDGALKGGVVDVTSKLLAIYVGVHSKTKFSYGADYESQFSVLAGSIKLKKKKDKKYTITFDNFKVKLENDEVSINGSASFDEF